MSEEQSYTISMLQTEEEARQVVAFFLSENSFDDDNYTPGELEHFKTNPYKCLTGDYYIAVVKNSAGEVIAVNCFLENEQQSGGYHWDYMVIHKEYRKLGIASELIDLMFNYLRQKKARYVLVYTCDLPEYEPIQHMFASYGFSFVGRCPDYYYEGEDRLIYYRKIEQ